MNPGQEQGERAAPVDLAALERGLRDHLDRERGPLAWLRSRSRPARVLLLLGFAVAVAALTWLVAGRADLATYPRTRMIATLAWFAAAAGAAAWLALRPIYLPRPARSTTALVLGFAVLGPLVTAVLPAAPTAAAIIAAENLWSWAYGCFACGVTAGLAALLFARAVDRGGSLATGQLALAAAAAGLVGNAALQLHCPINQPLHLLLGHATVPLGLLLGALLVRRRA